MQEIIIYAVRDDRNRTIGWCAKMPEGHTMSWLFRVQATEYLDKRYPECSYRVVE